MNALATLSGPQAAAVFVMLLDDGEAARLLAHLQPDELAEVGATMCELGDIDSAQIQSAIGSFVAEADREIIPAGDRGKQVRNLLGQAVGDMKAVGSICHCKADRQRASAGHFCSAVDAGA
jgi:flagellar motor switch protein FliG